MRFTDGLRAERDIHIDASVERVWQLVSDIELPVRFSPELQRVSWLDGADGPAVGARFEGLNHQDHLGDWRTISQVVELVEHRSFAWAVVDEEGKYGPATKDPAAALATWRFDLTPDGEGTRLRQSFLLGPGPSAVTNVIDTMPDKEETILAYRMAELRSALKHTLADIKSLAEQASD